MSGRRIKALRRRFFAEDPAGPTHLTGGNDGLKRDWRAFKRQEKRRRPRS